MQLSEQNIVEKIEEAFESNNNKLIAKTTRFVAENLANTVRNPKWKKLDVEVRLHVLEKAILFKDAEEEEDDSESGGDDRKPEPKIEFFQQKESFNEYRMFLKNTGNCRVACKLIAKTSFGVETVGEPRFMDVDDVWEMEDAKDMRFQRGFRKYFVEYVAARKSSSSDPEKLLEIKALNKSLQLEITD